MRSGTRIYRLPGGWLALAALLAAGAMCRAEDGQEEKFVPVAEWSRAALVEMRSEATVVGREIRLRDITRWGDSDRIALEAAGDLVIARFDASATTRRVDMDEAKTVLEGAGVNLATIRFQGAMSCKITRSDAGGDAPPIVQAVAPVARPQAPGGSTPIDPPTAPATPPVVTRNLREILLADLVDRYQVPLESLQIKFGDRDEKVLNLSEPMFSFQVRSRRQKDIGEVAWDVSIIGASSKQSVFVTANVRAWHTLVVTNRPLGYRQVFSQEDLTERRMLLDRLPEVVPLTKDQVIGQQAARDLNTGTVLTGRLIEPTQIVRAGELILVLVQRGHVQLKWVAEARENGAKGQSIRVRKPQTREEFLAVVTGPQEARLAGGSVSADLAAAP